MPEYKIYPEFPHLEIHSDGRVFSRRSNIFLSPSITARGYQIVSVQIERKNKTLSVHRLVAAMFCDNPDNKPQVNHIDGIKMNNNYKNLEWCTAQENTDHAIRMGLFRKTKNLERDKAFNDFKYIVPWSKTRSLAKWATSNGVIYSTASNWYSEYKKQR